MRFSIVISALDEPYLAKTIETILARSEPELLREIIVIDDGSAEPINYDHPLVTVVRNDERQGLIRSRNTGASLATGEFVISIDAHCKVGAQWLSPIAEILDADHRTIALPVTIGLDPIKWEASGSMATSTAWRWNLDFYWYQNDTDVSPAMAGHCFAFTKRWWNELGGFDDGMEQWGGENIEFSLKTWLCGGSVVIVKESIVAHYFKKHFHYVVEPKNLQRNKARIAEVWFDEYKKLFYSAIGKSAIDVGDVSRQIAFRQAKQVRPFSWYLDNLQPELKTQLLKNKFKGSRVAILGAGPTIDSLPKEILQLYDLVIGVNYVALTHDCDFVVFHDYKPALKVLHSKKYSAEQLFVPIALKDGTNRYHSSNISKSWNIYELGPQDSGRPLSRLDLPFFHHATSVHTAVHIAMFLGAKSITLFGCDAQFAVDGRSHARSIPEYRDGFYWNRGQDYENYINRINNGYALLRKAAARFNIDFLRHTFA